MRPPICDKTAPPHLENPGSATVNGSIYFVVSGVLGEFPRELKREIQLRTLDGCSKTLRMAAIGSGFVDFQILTCSSLVATIYR